MLLGKLQEEKRDNPLSSATPSEPDVCLRRSRAFRRALVHPRAAVLNAISLLFANRFAAVIGRLFDRIGPGGAIRPRSKGGLAAFAGLDSLGEQRVHLTDIGGFAGWRTGRRDGEALRHRQQRERIVAFRPAQ